MGELEREATIFHNRDGGVMTLHNLRRTFRAFVFDAGLDGLGITPRWYRRTGATVIARGIGLDAAAAFLGHTSRAVTEGHYVAPDASVDHSPAHVLDVTLRPVHADGRLLAPQSTSEEEDALTLIDDVDSPDVS